MTKEELIAQGLTEEQAKFVMAEHGKTVTTLNARITTLTQSETELQSQVAKNADDLKKLQKNAGSNEELKQQIKDLQKENAKKETEYQESLTKIQRDSALLDLATEMKAKNPKALASLLDSEEILFKDGKLTGAKEKIEEWQKSDSYMFDLGQKQGGYSPNAGNSVDKTYDSFEAAMEADDLETYFDQQEESRGGND